MFNEIKISSPSFHRNMYACTKPLGGNPSITYSLSNNYTTNCFNPTILVEVITEEEVTCFLDTLSTRNKKNT